MRVEAPESRWGIYQFPPAFVLGFHGCHAAVGEAILRGEVPHLLSSENDYDWLGSGIYFWEANPQRARDFAIERATGAPNSRGNIQQPFVLGAILDLGRCLDLRDSAALSEVKRSYDGFLLFSAEAQMPLPRNLGYERKLRKLDCAVMNFLHAA